MDVCHKASFYSSAYDQNIIWWTSVTNLSKPESNYQYLPMVKFQQLQYRFVCRTKTIIANCCVQQKSVGCFQQIFGPISTLCYYSSTLHVERASIVTDLAGNLAGREFHLVLWYYQSHVPSLKKEATGIMDYQGTIADDMLIISISGVLHISYFRIYSACEPHTVYFPITERCLSPAHWVLLNIISGRRRVLWLSLSAFTSRLSLCRIPTFRMVQCFSVVWHGFGLLFHCLGWSPKEKSDHLLWWYYPTWAVYYGDRNGSYI